MTQENNDYEDVDFYFGSSFMSEQYPKFHVLLSDSNWHIGWTLFRPPYREFGIHFFSFMDGTHSLTIYFGKGEFSINARKDNKLSKVIRWVKDHKNGNR